MRISVSLGAILLCCLAWSQEQQKPAAATQSANTPAASTPAATAPSANAQPAELKTQTYKGTLVDASCAGGTAQAPAANSKADQSQGCTVSANTKEFALRTKDGQTLKFDAVGNDRAEQAIKNKKKWTEQASSGKPIHATVSANANGDRLTVVAID